MTSRPTMRRTIIRIAAATVAAFGLGAPAAEIPIREESPNGVIAFPDGQTRLQIKIVVAGYWGRTQLQLLRAGGAVWRSNAIDLDIRASNEVDEKHVLLNVDVDGDGQPDWLVLQFPMLWSSNGMYGQTWNQTAEITEEKARRSLATEWSDLMCSALAGVIILSDMKTVYAFQYDTVRDPFAHRNPYVQGEAHYKRGIGTGVTETRLRATSPIPAKIWSGVRQLVETHACNTRDPISHDLLPANQRINWQAPQEPFPEDDGKQYLAEGLAMYQRALKLHDETAHDLPKEKRGTKYELGMFDFRHFFEAVPFDKVDAENKYPQYTAMLNDFAFYQMAPEADKAEGFEDRRVKVEGGVLAILAYVIQRDPQRAVAYMNLGDALWRNSRDQEAASYYRKYVELAKAKNPKAHIPDRVVKRIAIS